MAQKDPELWDLLQDEEQGQRDESRVLVVLICIIVSLVLLPFLELFILN